LSWTRAADDRKTRGPYTILRTDTAGIRRYLVFYKAGNVGAKVLADFGSGDEAEQFVEEQCQKT
jgi:hypothetical protein